MQQSLVGSGVPRPLGGTSPAVGFGGHTAFPLLRRREDIVACVDAKISPVKPSESQ